MAPKVKKIAAYPKERIQAAVNAVLTGGLSKRQAAKKYEIPRTTLIDRIAGRWREGKSIGRDPFLAADEEDCIVR